VAAAARTEVAVALPRIPFADITKDAGIRFVHTNGAEGHKLLPETMGGGCAFLDFDGDGDQDILFVNSNRWEWSAPASPPMMGLYQNDGGGKFSDVTAGSGLDVSFYGQGVAVGDYDNDGKVDAFISGLGGSRLFKNLGDGKFQDVTSAAGVGGAREMWSTSAAFLDYDNDGRLDLFVCNYVKWTRDIDRSQDFKLIGVGRAYGPPLAFGGSYSYLYHNNGDGTFSDVSSSAGIQVKTSASGLPMGKSLGVAPVDLDADGWIDIVVANDTVQNFVFHNQRNGSFMEVGSLTGIAFGSSGEARGAMGIDAAYFRNDHVLGICIGNFANEMSALYVGESLRFRDDAIATGLGPVTRQSLKFGTFFFDADLDGRLDVLHANGHLEHEINKVQSSQHYKQAAMLLWNCGPSHPTEFVSLTKEQCGEALFKPIVGRGAAYGDIDNDGDLDVLLMENGGEPLLLRNDQKIGNHWVRLSLVGSASNRSAIGAWVEVKAGGQTYRRQVMPSRSYLSQVELPVTIGLGKADRVDEIRITWPSGLKAVVRDVKVNQPMTIVEQGPGK
jgi:hypothetical protein